MRILLTNDDGVDAPMLADLATQLDALGDVDVIAPASGHDGRLALAQPRAAPIAVDEIRLPDGRPAFAVGGTPADCVRFSALGLAGGKPDVVISGPEPRLQPGRRRGLLRHGRSGARGAHCWACRPLRSRSSQARTANSRLTALGRFALQLVPLLASGALPPGVVINVNAPAGAGRGRARGAARAPPLPARSCARPARPRAAGATTGSTATRRCGSRASRAPTSRPSPRGASPLTPLRFDLFAEDALAPLAALLPEAG